jgi:hypothetical protein
MKWLARFNVPSRESALTYDDISTLGKESDSMVNNFSVRSVLVSMSTYGGTSTPGNELDNKFQQILDGEHAGFNVDVQWH